MAPLDVRRLTGAVADAHDPEFQARRLLGGVPVDIAAPDDLEVLEPGFCKLIRKLCFQQSAGDSTGPKVYVSLRAFRDRFINQDIGYL